jgi:hypothetical protein
MWTDARLLTAINALPPEAFIDGAPEDAELMWRRVVKRLRAAHLGDPDPQPDAGHLAQVIDLPARRPRRSRP